MRYPEFVEHLDGAHGALVATVKTMVIGREQQVETRTLQLSGPLVGRAKAGVARIGCATKRHFQIHYRAIGTLNVGLNILETLAIIIGVAPAMCRCDLWRMLHGIAKEHKIHITAIAQQRQQRQEHAREKTAHKCLLLSH